MDSSIFSEGVLGVLIILAGIGLYLSFRPSDKLTGEIDQLYKRISDLEHQVFHPRSDWDEDYKTSITLRARVRDLEYEIYKVENPWGRSIEVQSLRAEFCEFRDEVMAGTYRFPSSS